MRLMRTLTVIVCLMLPTVGVATIAHGQQRPGQSAVELGSTESKLPSTDSADLRQNAGRQNSSVIYPTSSIALGIASLVAAGLAGFLYVSRRKLGQLNRALLDEIEAGNKARLEQEQLKRRISRLQRMESLGALAGGVAHDFNNLLVGVLCNAELIKNDDVATEVKAECLQGIIDSAEAASDLSQMMMAYTGKHPARTETIDLGELLADMLPLFRAASLKHTIEVEPFAEPVHVLADATQIEQALLNLVNNAVASLDSPDGKVTIRMGSVKLDRVDEHQFHGRRREGGTFAFIEIADDGCGIGEDRIERIFEPFYSEGKSGRGLGLALVYGNIIRHDGLIQCNSKLGEGTTMRVLLPAVTANAASNGLRDTKATVARTYLVGHALVIDDELSVLQAIERMLVSNGWTCDTYQQPKAALAALGAGGRNPDCVVVDVRMPEMDGEAVIEHLLQNHPALPVTVLSGYSKTNLHDFQRFPNVVNTLAKPFSMHSVMGSLESAVKPR